MIKSVQESINLIIKLRIIMHLCKKSTKIDMDQKIFKYTIYI